MTPEENFRFINSYLSRMGPIIRKHRGFIDKYIGDGIMALFPRSAGNALDAAIAMQKEMQIYNRHRAKCGYAPVRIGIGIHFGDTIIGTIGENERIEVTVISDTVNVASRLESLSKRYGAGILVSGPLLSEIPRRKKYRARYTDRVRAKGKQSPVDIFEILDGLAPEEFHRKLHNRPVLQKALKTYLAGKPVAAADLLIQLGENLATDKAALVLRNKIDQFIALPEEARGDTVETLYD
jgi:two-component system sensor histidine kinase ChiS